MRTVEIADVDVVHARRDRLAKNRDRTGNMRGGPQTRLSLSCPASCMAPQPIRFTVSEVPANVKLAKRAIKSGDIRKDLDPIDLLRALIGVANVATSPDWQQSARRLVDILITSSRPVK